MASKSKIYAFSFNKLFTPGRGSVWRNSPNLCCSTFWILREPLDVYERPFGVWRFGLLALPLVGFESLVKRNANPPIRKMETSVNVALSNQTNTNDTTKITNPIVVVFQFAKMRSSIAAVFAFQIIATPPPNRVRQRRDHRDQSDDLRNLSD